MTKSIDTIGIYDVNQDVSGKFATVYLRDLNDEYLLPPVQVKPSFGRKLKSHLDNVVDSDMMIESGDYHDNVGVVSGVIVEDEETGISKVDWSTVNLNKMTQERVNLDKASVDFNAKGVYGSIASGHVRPIDAGDNVIAVSDGHEAFHAFDIHGDSSKFADTNLKLLVNPVPSDFLDAQDEEAIQREFAKYGNSLLGSSQEDHVDDLIALQDAYNHDLYSSNDIEELKTQPEILGSIKDIASDVKAFAKSKETTVDAVLSEEGGVFQSVQTLVYSNDTETMQMVPKNVPSDEYADFAAKRQTERGINPVVFSNLTVESIDVGKSTLKIRNWDNAKINDSVARKFAKDMRHVVTSEMEPDENKRPYSIKTALDKSREIEAETAKTQSVNDYAIER